MEKTAKACYKLMEASGTGRVLKKSVPHQRFSFADVGREV